MLEHLYLYISKHAISSYLLQIQMYNKPIRNTILHFNTLVSDLDIETSSPDS